MAKTTSLNHKIKKYIIEQLKTQNTARFRDLRPPRTDTNLFTYHLNSLVEMGMVSKVEGGYTLGSKGIFHISNSENSSEPRFQPKLVAMVVIQNGEGDVLLQKQETQPYIDTWGLPYSEMLPGDGSVSVAAQRIANENLGLKNQEFEQAGDCYIRVYVGGELASVTFAHVFRFYSDDIKVGDNLMWARPHKLSQIKTSPATEDIMTRTFFKDSFYFEEYEVDWYN